MAEWVRNALADARDAVERLLASDSAMARIDEASGLIAERLGAGGKVLACGNGGSACDAMHFCEELTGRFRNDRPPLPAIACVDPGHLTCVANDYGFDEVFARWVEGLGREGDVLVALSTSGNSANVIQAVERAKEGGLRVIALLGRDGGELAGAADVEWIVAGETSDRVQEAHMVILHLLVEGVERRLFAG